MTKRVAEPRDRTKSAQVHFPVFFYLEPGLEHAQGLPYFTGAIRVQDHCADALRRYMKDKKEGFCFRIVSQDHGPPGGVKQARSRFREQMLFYNATEDTNEGLSRYLAGSAAAAAANTPYSTLPAANLEEPPPTLRLPGSLLDYYDDIDDDGSCSRSTAFLDGEFQRISLSENIDLLHQERNEPSSQACGSESLAAMFSAIDHLAELDAMNALSGHSSPPQSLVLPPTHPEDDMLDLPVRKKQRTSPCHEENDVASLCPSDGSSSVCVSDDE